MRLFAGAQTTTICSDVGMCRAYSRPPGFAARAKVSAAPRMAGVRDVDEVSCGARSVASPHRRG
ncbi:hypothetical protein PSEUDO8Z_120098 [Pseudomonas sp. 8Z]|nr:hypothetical protein PSEUDO8Z_120098 [Pseudomonas sp. 8Z]